MIKAPIGLQELQRRIYRKAKSDTAHRFGGLFGHITKAATLAEAYRIAKRNGGAAGIDGQTCADIASSGGDGFLADRREDLMTGRANPQPNRRVAIPQGNGHVRELQIPCIRDRVVQGALQRILEALFEADVCPHSYGFRPKRSPHRALAEVRRRVLRRMSTVIDVDLSRYFDTMRHSILLDRMAKRIQAPAVMHLIKQILKAGGPVGVPQGGPFSPLAANIYLHEVDWMVDAIRRKTAEGPYEAVNYHRCADDSVITVSGHHQKQGGGKAGFATTRGAAPTAWCGDEPREDAARQHTERRSLGVPRVCPAPRASTSGGGLLSPDDPKEDGSESYQSYHARHHSQWGRCPCHDDYGAYSCRAGWLGHLLSGRQGQSCLQ